ncbi:FHA domain-containing protein [Candidatus Woesearchaeota archaeon]|nr:FHA domain-containing protein [Candidatus Woesearchaeota archaeon]
METPNVYLDHFFAEDESRRYDLEGLDPGDYVIIGRQPRSGTLLSKLRHLPMDLGLVYIPWETQDAGGIRLLDQDVSLGHAIIMRGKVGALEKQYWLFDLESTNGTWVNRTRVHAGVPVMLGQDSRIGLGYDREDLAFRNKKI